VKHWKVEIHIDEHDSRTRAQARLNTGETTTLIGIGHARRNPNDPSVPEIGDELAVARALADLAHQLLDATTADIEAITQRPAQLTE
jgi:hypothetical protein